MPGFVRLSQAALVYDREASSLVAPPYHDLDFEEI
jgi:hypothetical protein